MEVDEAGDPADKRPRSPASTRTIEERTDSAVRVLERIRGCRKSKFWMQIAGTIFMEITKRLGHDHAKLRGALPMISEPGELVCELRSFGLVLRIHERVREALQLLATLPEGHGPLVVAAHRFEAQKEMGLATLEDPTLLLGDASGTTETVGNDGRNAVPCLPRNPVDGFSPPLMRLVTGSQDRAQEMEIVSLHPSKTEEVHRVRLIVLAEPHRIHDQDEATSRDDVRPRSLAETHERLRMTLRESSRAHGGSS